MSITKTAPTVKTLAQQNAERLKRAEEQYPLYSVSSVTVRIPDAAGVLRTMPAFRVVSPKGESYLVTRQGCSCEDHRQAKEQGIERRCKHQWFASWHHKQERAAQDEALEPIIEQINSSPDPDLSSEEARAADTLANLTTGGRDREAFERQMNEDFGITD